MCTHHTRDGPVVLKPSRHPLPLSPPPLLPIDCRVQSTLTPLHGRQLSMPWNTGGLRFNGLLHTETLVQQRRRVHLLRRIGEKGLCRDPHIHPRVHLQVILLLVLVHRYVQLHLLRMMTQTRRRSLACAGWSKLRLPITTVSAMERVDNQPQLMLNNAATRMQIMLYTMGRLERGAATGVLDPLLPLT
jgi:hypothetical protein